MKDAQSTQRMNSRLSMEVIQAPRAPAKPRSTGVAAKMPAKSLYIFFTVTDNFIPANDTDQ